MSSRRAELLRPRKSIATDIDEQIKKGRGIKGRVVYGHKDEDVSEERERTWSKVNESLLANSFDTDIFLNEYLALKLYYPPDGSGYAKRDDALAERIEKRISELDSIQDQLKFMREADLSQKPLISTPPRHATVGFKVFIVHGHDEGARDAVTLFVKNLGLTPIVLQEKPNEGLSIDRKLEKYSNVDHAIVILTPDDGSNPRPNVVLELGWFRRALGNERVSILYKEGCNIPSDVGGVERTLMDRHGGWRQKIARDIKARGIEIDPDWFSKG
jgi:predicted nucleotide-binding protein